MASGNRCNCGSIKRPHLDYECNLRSIDPVLYPDGWNSIYDRAEVDDDIDISGRGMDRYGSLD